MFTHAITFITGLIIGSMFISKKTFAFINPDFIFNSLGLIHLSQNSKAIIVAVFIVLIGLSIRAIARRSNKKRE